MSIRLISIAILGFVFGATILLSFDSSNNKFNTQQLKNETLVLGMEIDRDSIVIPVPGGAVGPESLSFEGRGGGPYTGVSDGRIIRWRANESRWVDFAVTSPESRDGCVGPHDHTQMEHICGRPLGLRFNVNTSELYIADAYMGLLVVGPNGGLASPVAKEADGVAFGFTNSLDVDQNSGAVYFTDSSSRFPRRNYVSIIISGDNTGRLIKFEPKTKKTTLLVNNLKFPNGVALSQSGDFLLFVETTTCRVSPVDVTKLHSCLARLIGGNGMGIKLDRDGNVVEVLDSSKGKKWKFVSEVEEENGNLWIGSVTRSVIVKDKVSSYSN
ncbi:hypothetical protein DH2020_041590 [Rehmannia glutinosa]|uniref:Strictosidine synthase conserved region domain-containing protein n=1 Tax=Rehmannia glutinosa TaxID=99300 RepID=A0ABR0UQV4_REHGL